MGFCIHNKNVLLAISLW